MPVKTVTLILSLISLSITLPVSYAEITAISPSDQQTVSLDMQNMSCAMCTFTIKKALQNVAGVQRVSVDFDSKTATVTIDPKLTNSETLIKATKNAGYPATERLDKQ